MTRSGVRLKKDAGDEETLLNILVVRDSMSKVVSAHVVPVKGGGEDGYAAEKLRRDIQWLGHSRVILRSDNENPIVALLREALRALKVEVIDAGEPHPAPYDSKGNGGAENGVKQVQGILRTLKECLETRIGARIPVGHPLMAWMVRHASWILTTRSRGIDGRTPYERVRGRGFARKMVGFGEICLFKLPSKGPEAHGADGKLAGRWCRGAFLGYDRLSNEYVFQCGGRIGKSRALQRVVPDRRWSALVLQEVTASPYGTFQNKQQKYF